MFSLAIIIPCFNEATRLDSDAFISFAKTYPYTLLVFVNDGSTDRTVEILQTIKHTSPNNINVITKDQNIGKGESIRTGILYCINLKIKHVGYLDADLSTPLSEILRLFNIAEKEDVDIVLGSRVKKIDTLIIRSGFRHFIGRVIATIIDTRFKLGCYDTQCGAKIMKVAPFINILQQSFYTKWFFDVELLLRYRKQYGRFKALEIALTSWTKKEGSKVHILKTGLIVKELYYLFTKYK